MILKFVFTTQSTNGVIEKILLRVAKATNTQIGLSRDSENLYAYIKGEEDELNAFSSALAKELPMSVFLKSLNAEISEEFKDDLVRDFPKINLPPCPKCISEVKDESNENYYNPFHHCEVCGYSVNEQEKMENGKLFFEKLAEKLKEEGKIYIQTMNGKFEISTNLENAERIVAVDLASVATYFMSFEGDAKALGSIEKPYVKLKTNLNFKKEYGLSTPAFYVKLPDCMVLELLCDALGSEVKLLGLKKTDNPKDFQFEVDNEDTIPVAVVSDTKYHDILIESGDRSLLEKYENGLNKEVVAKRGYYKCISGLEKSVLFKDKKEGELKTSAVYAGFYGVISQWDLQEKTVMGFGLYKNEESKVLVSSPKFGIIEYVDFNFAFKNAEEVFASIRAMNETGEKLINNYLKNNENIFKKALNASFETKKKGVAYLWGVIGVILGFDNNIDGAYEKLINYATSAMSKKGPRIDYKSEKNVLNPLWAIRTAMSFRLAGVDDYLLSYGIIESFAEFLSNLYDGFDKETPLDGALMVGDLFTGELLNKTYTYISKNHKVYTPKALAISGAVEPYGECVILSNG